MSGMEGEAAFVADRVIAVSDALGAKSGGVPMVFPYFSRVFPYYSKVFLYFSRVFLYFLVFLVFLGFFDIFLGFSMGFSGFSMVFQGFLWFFFLVFFLLIIILWVGCSGVFESGLGDELSLRAHLGRFVVCRKKGTPRF